MKQDIFVEKYHEKTKFSVLYDCNFSRTIIIFIFVSINIFLGKVSIYLCIFV